MSEAVPECNPSRGPPGQNGVWYALNLERGKRPEHEGQWISFIGHTASCSLILKASTLMEHLFGHSENYSQYPAVRGSYIPCRQVGICVSSADRGNFPLQEGHSTSRACNFANNVLFIASALPANGSEHSGHSYEFISTESRQIEGIIPLLYKSSTPTHRMSAQEE
ncbi:hypothetical protein Pelo_19486 [Pelomyxa schiedti]|nr:hypothetical protein Pelo_19486 [Pelomyxa schiedti]